jgi:hypothetical protein
MADGSRSPIAATLTFNTMSAFASLPLYNSASSHVIAPGPLHCETGPLPLAMSLQLFATVVPSSFLFSLAIQLPVLSFGGCSVWEVVSPSDYFLHTERYQGCLPKSNYVMLVHHVIYLHRAEGSSEKGYFFVLGRNVFLSTCSVEDSAQSPLSRTSCICPFRYVVLRTLSTTSTSL